jgi:hypothetical protein
MPIDFRCPSCTAVLRISDEFGSKQVKCPHCERTCIAPAAAAVQPQPSQPEPAPEPLPGVPGPPPDTAPPFNPNAPRKTTVARRMMRRNRKRRGGWIVPAIFGICLFAAVLAYQKYFGAPLTGELQAVVVDENEFEPVGLVHRDLSGISKSRTNTVLDALETQSRRIESNVMVIDLQGGKRGIRVFMQNGLETQFYKVRVDNNRELQEYCDENIAKMDQALHDELSAAANRFFKDYEQSLKDEEEFKDVVDYRELLALNAMVGGLGYYVQAKKGEEAFPCVFEDSEALYFLLKPGTERFEIVGRELANGTTPFPGHYKVRVERGN